MSVFNNPVSEVISQRYSCRAYDKKPIAGEEAQQLAAFIKTIKAGPLGTPLRFELALALAHDPNALRGLGTYGLIKDPAGFVIGAVGGGEKRLEDFGYGLEAIVLCATDLGLASCWLGGNFTKSSFSRKIKVSKVEIVPAVASIGYPVEGMRARDPLRRKVKSDLRLAWEALFFRANFGTPLPQEAAGVYASPLAMLRLAPSSHNYQPWRVVQDGARYHFYLQRTPGVGPGTLMFILLGAADLQRLEIGIAMCHFDLTAREMGLAGKWIVSEPALQQPVGAVEYVATWVSEGNRNERLLA